MQISSCQAKTFYTNSPIQYEDKMRTHSANSIFIIFSFPSIALRVHFFSGLLPDEKEKIFGIASNIDIKIPVE